VHLYLDPDITSFIGILKTAATRCTRRPFWKLRVRRSLKNFCKKHVSLST
jgi:hypothetical protein